MTLAPAPVVRSDVKLLLGESMGDFTVTVLEPTASRGPASLEAKPRSNSTPGWGSTVWSVRPRVTFAAGQRIVLAFSYAGGKTPGFIFYLGPEGSFAGGVNTAWYPQLFDSATGTSWATGTLRFRAPPAYTVIASGVPSGDQRSAGDSAVSVRYSVEQPTYFASRPPSTRSSGRMVRSRSRFIR
jgi:hypothetical protein